MKWVLIIFLFGAPDGGTFSSSTPSVAADHVEFDTESACRMAGTALTEAFDSFKLAGITAACFPKGDKEAVAVPPIVVE